jgi:putative ABC transport system substrate-binding protein
VTVAVGILAAPLGARAQTAGKVHRIGLFDHHAPEPARREWWNALRQRLRERGYVEGKNIIFESRWGDGRDDSLPMLAAELVGLNVEVIVAASTEAILAVQKATRTVPIVITAASNPVETGMVASLARPGGNVTGTSFLGAEVAVKQLELLTTIVPGLSRIAVLSSPNNASHPVRLKLVHDAARGLGRASTPRLEDSYRTVWILRSCSGRRLTTWTRSSRAPSPPIFPCSNPRSSSS